MSSTLLEVLRRVAYKGGLANDASLPVDGMTVMGILLVVGSVLNAPGLPTKTLDSSVKLLATMEEKCNLPCQWLIIPGNRGLFAIDVNDNKISSKKLKELLMKLEIPWPRPLLIKVTLN